MEKKRERGMEKRERNEFRDLERVEKKARNRTESEQFVTEERASL